VYTIASLSTFGPRCIHLYTIIPSLI
jgi:hypothetical protein